MKQKLFVWAYTHYSDRVETCALTSEGKMLLMITVDKRTPEGHQEHFEVVEMVFKDNKYLNDQYDVHVVNQNDLERHIYKGETRDLIPKDFQVAWDKYKAVA
jgi:hypothetical protein